MELDGSAKNLKNVFENRDLKKEMKKGEKALKLKTLVTLLLEEIEQFWDQIWNPHEILYKVDLVIFNFITFYYYIILYNFIIIIKKELEKKGRENNFYFS